MKRLALVLVPLALAACGGSGGPTSTVVPTEPQPPPVPPSTPTETTAMPAIVIESPMAGDSVSSPLHVTGTANTFEANFTLELRTGGRLLATKFVTATSGSGTRGTFEVEVPFHVSEETRAEVVAYEPSAKDGTPMNEVSVPIGLLP